MPQVALQQVSYFPASSRSSIWSSVLARKQPFSIISHYGLNVVCWIVHLVTLRTIAYFENQAVAVATVLQVVGRAIGRKARHVACAKDPLAAIGA